MRRTKDSSDKLDGFVGHSVGGTLKMPHGAWLPQLYGLPSFQLNATHTYTCTHILAQRERHPQEPQTPLRRLALKLLCKHSNSNNNFTKNNYTLQSFKFGSRIKVIALRVQI